MFFVYAIASLSRNYIYVGMTIDIEKRYRRHNEGREKTTRAYRPFKLIFTEVLSEREEARRREKYWKSGIGKEKLRIIRDKE